MKKTFLITFFILMGFGSINAQNRDQLFSLKEIPSAKPNKTSIASVRESEIQVNFESMLRGSSARLSITLFDGKVYEAAQEISEGFEMRAMDDFTWRGKIVSGKFTGDVILTAKKGYLAGLIYSPEAVYEITPKGDKTILIELNQSLFPPCGGEVPGETVGRKDRIVSPEGVGTDSADRIDVMVVYTTATKNTVGGDAQAQTIAQSAIDVSNTSYLNSKILQRVRLAHTQEHLYTEISFSTDLSNLRNNATIQTLRSDHQADLVGMLSETTGACGIGNLMGSVGGNSNNAFTVTARSCAVGNLSFPHELGHNMGSSHNPENGSGGTFSYSFGHWVNGSYRTVMSYSDPCTAGCTRRPYFSNPGIIFNNVPTGIENARDNVRSINNTADAISNYRYSGTSLTLNSLNNGEIVPRNISRTINWSTDNIAGGNVRIEISRDQTTNWETLIAGTPNDGSQVINIGGRPTKGARLRITSIENPTVSDTSVRNFVIK